MSNKNKHQLLNNITHHNLKIITTHGAEYGDNIGTVLAFPTEFSDLQKEYPIFFRKDSGANEFQAVTMLGLYQNKNLFLKGNTWQANYIPADIVRGPFAIGFQDQSTDGGDEQAPVVHIDINHPRVSEEYGHPVFLEHGGNSPYLQHITRVFTKMIDGISISKAMFSIFEELDLLEPLAIEVRLLDNELHKFHGNYTISKEKLNSLSQESLYKLHQSGFLESAILALSSLGNIQKLVNWQNESMQQDNQAQHKTNINKN